MALITKARAKYALAGVGAVYLVLFAGYLVYAGMSRSAPRGPSELEAHPERQDEILARQRAEEMKTRLGLTDDQTQQIAGILQTQAQAGPPADPSAPGDFRGRGQAVQQQIAAVLTPEQQAQALYMMRGPGGGPPGGPGGGPPGGGRRGFMGRMSPERIEALQQKMTPDQRARFDKSMQRMEQRRAQREQERGQQGGPRGPGQRRSGPPRGENAQP